jgi:hypothetical protein
MPSSLASNQFRLLNPEVIDLESDDFEIARKVSSIVLDEPQQWQLYLNTLARLGLTHWLSRFSEKFVDFDNDNLQLLKSILSTAEASICQIGSFKFCLFTMEDVLNETVRIPQKMLNLSAAVAHFYIVAEIQEEQAQMILRGFCCHQQLVQHCTHNPFQSTTNCCYKLPLSIFDIELNHLLFYTHFLEPDAFMPAGLCHKIISSPSSIVSQDLVAQSCKAARTSLSTWLKNIVEAEWFAIDQLFYQESELAFSTRSYPESTQKGKFINLGMELGEQRFALLVNITPEPEDKLVVLVQLYPTGEPCLPPNLTLSLVSKVGKLLQEVSTRSHDNYIQLKSFQGELGQSFSIDVSCDGISHRENFVF